MTCFRPRTDEAIRSLIDTKYPHLANIALKAAPISPFAVPDD